MDDLLRNAHTIKIDSSVDHVKGVLQKRIEYAETTLKVPSGSLIQVTDSAYQSIADLTHNSPGLALEVLRRVLPSAEQLAQTHPYIITEDQIANLGMTYEDLCAYWNSPFRGATVVHLKQ
jgi:hypothetical protein